MNALDYIDHSIPFLKTTDSVIKGLGWMEEYKILNLAVVEAKTKQYLGLVSEIVLLNEGGNDLLTQDMLLHSQELYVKSNDHIYEALRVISKTELDVCAVVDSDGRFLGTLTANMLLNCMNEFTSATDHGGVIELLMYSYEYSLVEISRAVESNGARVLSSYVSSIKDEGDKVKVVIKLNVTDVSLVVTEFQQLNYIVTGIYSDFEAPNDISDNYRHLFKYLNL